MSQIVLFAVGYALMSLGVLIALLRGGKDPAPPRPSTVIGLVVTIAGCAVTIAGGAAG